MSNVIAGKPWIEDRSGDVLNIAWVATDAKPASRAGRDGRVFQAEEKAEMRGVLEQMIGSAREVVMISSFLFADANLESALLNASKRGVRVYLLVASEAKLEKDVRENDSFSRETLADHKRLLNEFAGWVCMRTAEFFHAKFVLVDPKTQPRGMLLTANLTKEALTRNHELGVYLVPNDVRALASLFVWAFWEAAQHELLEAGGLPPVVGPEKRMTMPERTGAIVATAGSRRDLRQTVLRLIRSAKRTLVVSTFGIADEEVVQALIERVKERVAVVLLVRHPRIGMLPILEKLAQAGVSILGVSKHLHAKAILVDGTYGLVMTANLETHGLEDGFEMGVELAGGDAAALARFLETWHAGALWRLRVNTKIGELLGSVQVPNGKDYRDLTIEPKGRVNDGIVNVDSCTRIAAAKAPPASVVPGAKRYHSVEHEWSIELPTLRRSAKPWPLPKAKDGGSVKVPPFPIFDEPGFGRVFAIEDISQVEAAKRSMSEYGIGAVVLRGER
ncbi:MAG TPA: phospholipase D-like domain-containing protein [Polyangium sp.]|nr:phospholipase D-like domain-containing protein [Polyangium sp.]